MRFLKDKNKIIFCSKFMQQEYNSRQEFEENANIDGRLLKNIWDEVSFAGFMFCG